VRQSEICIDKLLVEKALAIRPLPTSKIEVAVIKRFHTPRHRAAGATSDHSPIKSRHFQRHTRAY